MPSTNDVLHVARSARHLETHGSIAWRGDDGRIHIRTSSQAPFIAHEKLCYLFSLRPRDLHVFTERRRLRRQAGDALRGFCVLALLRQPPVRWEFTRGSSSALRRAPDDDRVKLGAKRDGTLTAIEPCRLEHRGYGGHASETLAASLGSPMTMYRCANKRRSATWCTQHGSRRWVRLRLSQSTSASNAGMIPLSCAR
jgi:CO/xanthine dehydrogenase Mo-binding subunit